MKRKLYKKEEMGLKGGPNYQVSEMTGSVTTTGYWPDSPDRNNDFNIIPSNQITMEGMDIPLMGIDDMGNMQHMVPGENYTFPGNYVTEIPVASQGGMYLGHYAFKDGGLVRMDPGGPTKKQAAADKINNQQQARAWDANELYGGQEEMLNYDPKTGEYKNWKGEVVKVETKPMVIGSPKGAPKKSKADVERERAIKYDKQTQADPKLWLQEHPEYMLDADGKPVLKSWMESNAPEDKKTLDIKQAKEDFVNDLNSDPLQQSLGTASLDNPITAKAAENYANYTVNNEDPRWTTDKMISGNDTPTTADFYNPHGATLEFGVPAAIATAISLGGGSPAIAAGIGEGWQGLTTAAKPLANAWNSAMNAKLLGDAGIFATEGQQILANLATPANLLKTWGIYDLTHKYAPNAVEDVNLYNQTGDTKYLTDAAYNTGKGFLEGFSHIGPISQEVQAIKRPASFIDDARKAAKAENSTDQAIYDFKTFKNAMGLIRKDGGGIYLGAYKQVGGQLVPHDTNMGSFQKGGEPIYVESEDDPRYKNYKELVELYTRSKKAAEKDMPDHSYTVNVGLNYKDIKKDAQGYYVPDPFNPGRKDYLGMFGDKKLNFLIPGTELNKIYTDAFTRNVKPIGFMTSDYALPIYQEPGQEVIVEARPKAIDIKPLPTQSVDIKPALTNLPLYQTNKQRVVVNTPQGDKIRVQDAKTKRFIDWEELDKAPVDIENPSGTASQDFPEMRRIKSPRFAYGGDMSVPSLNRQEGGDMPFGLPLKEQNIYTLPEYIQPKNPKTGEILPDPQRPNLGMGTGATEYKYTYGTDEGDIDIPSIVAGQYIGDQALDRYRLTGERFKTMADPGSYSNFYMQMKDLGLMQEKHGGSVKKVKIKSLPKNWKSQ